MFEFQAFLNWGQETEAEPAIIVFQQDGVHHISIFKVWHAINAGIPNDGLEKVDE
jgi:hypothetical protein